MLCVFMCIWDAVVICDSAHHFHRAQSTLQLWRILRESMPLCPVVAIPVQMDEQCEVLSLQTIYRSRAEWWKLEWLAATSRWCGIQANVVTLKVFSLLAHVIQWCIGTTFWKHYIALNANFGMLVHHMRYMHYRKHGLLFCLAFCLLFHIQH